MSGVSHSTEFLQKRILADVLELRDRLKHPVLFTCEGFENGKPVTLTVGSENLVKWFEERSGNGQYKQGIHDDIMALTSQDDSPPRRERPNRAGLNAARANRPPEKLKEPLEDYSYKAVLNYLSKKILNVEYQLILFICRK